MSMCNSFVHVEYPDAFKMFDGKATTPTRDAQPSSMN